MGILLYQMAIVATFAAVRALAPSKLLVAALICSGLTIFNLTWPPLIALQLVVVWGSFTLLRPRTQAPDAPKGSASPTKRDAQVVATLPSQNETPSTHQRPPSAATPVAHSFSLFMFSWLREAPVFVVAPPVITESETWRPSFWGKLFSGSDDWTLRFAEDGVCLTIGTRECVVGTADAVKTSLEKGIFWSSCELLSGQTTKLKLGGLPNTRAEAPARSLRRLSAEYSFYLIRRRSNTLAAQLHRWHEDVATQLQLNSDNRRWLTHERQQALLAAHHQLADQAAELKLLLGDVAKFGEPESTLAPFKTLLRVWHSDWPSFWRLANERPLGAGDAPWPYRTLHGAPTRFHQERLIRTRKENIFHSIAAAPTGAR